MALKQCNNGHYYNDSESATCPYCSGKSSLGKTIPLDAEKNNSNDTLGKTIPLDANTNNNAFAQTEMLDTVNPNGVNANSNFGPTKAPEDDSKFSSTQFIDTDKNSNILPVRGWLVVVEGEKLGLDFRIHTGRNSIGRSKNNDVCIDFDSAISKEKACFVIYDEKHTAFHIVGGESANNIYVNEEILLMPRQLLDNDIIEIGKTKLVFRSLCNAQFNY